MTILRRSRPRVVASVAIAVSVTLAVAGCVQIPRTYPAAGAREQDAATLDLAEELLATQGGAAAWTDVSTREAVPESVAFTGIEVCSDRTVMGPTGDAGQAQELYVQPDEPQPQAQVLEELRTVWMRHGLTHEDVDDDQVHVTGDGPSPELYVTWSPLQDPRLARLSIIIRSVCERL
ncbi:hypothetical protein [Clavibacter michiganensis]|uniref:Lipoprotein n=1 Tax=Clavibacter michiganensis subsp. insidiosus TaxID=33014 RepID=A0A0D5CI84_9MICO|nr:hypothetical protein [Clavibacter michiganensis]AJW78999.1 hypothetical protein VO01_07525 [Clavibacter michiganensis subsp. insidiosus]AWF98313.1 hypothetical protein BEH61_07315 [Clavibacter michiganensis subsp. insidiosus]AWG01485.1 hypothetical protein BEH62_07755 [Clavibacter michiganensis subsp. insidiosus]OQJ59983.1 hypothetical protein B5P21_08715 [Clavibacter michiganensis subsp. insidiosus]RII88427.1 hypothetical protein DZF92_03195 [Clavibacter michiganensis subsp. insidiosus]